MLKTPDEVVDGRVVGALLVAVVEAVELRREHPQRQQRDEDEVLGADAERVRRAGRPGVGSSLSAKASVEPEHVGADERPADEPAAAAAPCRRAGGGGSPGSARRRPGRRLRRSGSGATGRRHARFGSTAVAAPTPQSSRPSHARPASPLPPARASWPGPLRRRRHGVSSIAAPLPVVVVVARVVALAAHVPGQDEAERRRRERLEQATSSRASARFIREPRSRSAARHLRGQCERVADAQQRRRVDAGRGRSRLERLQEAPERRRRDELAGIGRDRA